MAVDETHIRALKNLFVAQRFYPDKYEQFKKNLAISDIPFAFSNPKFLDALIVFSHSFETFLKEQKELPAPPEVMDAVAPRVLVESIAQKLPTVISEIDKGKRQRMEDLVGEFAKKLGVVARVRDQDELKKRLLGEISRIKSKNSRELGEEIEKAFARVVATAAQSEEFASRAKPIAKEVLQKSKRELDVITAPDPSEEIITEAMMKSPARKDLWLETYIKLSAIDPSPKFEVVDRLALVAEALHATPPKEVTYNIFSRVGVGGLQKPIQGVLGAVVSVIPNAREKIIASGWSAATNLEKTQERFGRLITESPIYTRALERGNRVFGGRARNFVWDLASSIAGPPVAADVFVLEILGLAPESYSMVQVQTANSHSRSPGFFGLVFSEAAGWGLQKGVAAVAKKTGWKVGAGLGARFGSLFGGIFGALIGGFFGGGLGALFGKKQPGPPKKWYQTEFALAAGLVLLPILLIVVLMSMKMIAEFGTFNEQQVGGGVRRRGGGPTINCLAPENLDNPLCKFESCTGDNCAWPATGTIIQGPFAQCDGTTHSVVDAIDILGNYLDPVYSATGGTIVNVVGGCADNPLIGGCNQNYGNYVEVQTPDRHTLRYSHLSELFLDKVQVGQSVEEGKTIIGKMGASGTESDHLHLEVRGQPQGQSVIAKYLPVDENFAKELYQCINVSGCRSCPQM